MGVIVWTTKYGLGAKSFTFFTEPSKHLWGVPVVHVRKERPREIMARARHSPDSEAEALNYHLPGHLELAEMGSTNFSS